MTSYNSSHDNHPEITRLALKDSDRMEIRERFLQMMDKVSEDLFTQELDLTRRDAWSLVGDEIIRILGERKK